MFYAPSASSLILRILLTTDYGYRPLVFRIKIFDHYIIEYLDN